MDFKVHARRGMSRWLALSAGVVMMFSVSSANADSVEAMCHKSKTICTCAARQLKIDVGDDDYRLYEAVGAGYMARQASGMKREDAWDAAVKAEADQLGSGFGKTLSRTNAVGKAHRKAIKACTD